MSAPIVLEIRDRPDRARLSLGGDPDPRRSLVSCDVDLDTGYFTVLLGYENVQPPAQVTVYRWHISIGGGDRVPTWNEFVAITHAWDVDDPPLVASWAANPSVRPPT